MNTVVIILSIYALTSTLILLYQQKRKPKLSASGDELAKLASAMQKPTEKADVLVEIIKLEQSQIPWWERAFSTIGIIALASMSVAATVQTLNATFVQEKLDQSERQVSQLKKEIGESTELLATMSKMILEQYRDFGRRDTTAVRLLNFRLDQILNTLAPTAEQLKDAYAISLALEQYDVALSILNQHPDIMSTTLVADRVTLAEFYVLSGALEQAKPLIETVAPDYARLDKSIKMRFLVVDSVLHGSDKNVAAVQALLKISPEEAKVALEKKMGSLQNAVERLRSGAT